MAIFKRIHRAILKRINPLDYAKLVGVNFKGGGYTSMGELNGAASPGLSH